MQGGFYLSEDSRKNKEKALRLGLNVQFSGFLFTF